MLVDKPCTVISKAVSLPASLSKIAELTENNCDNEKRMKSSNWNRYFFSG
jgi:hypothetical protein